ncbi:MAG: anti-sigma factor [Alphaproteobacteria bacterium]
MTPEERAELERQAAEYALGTLPEDERARFEARLSWDAEVCRLVDDWDRRLAPLAEAVPPVAPPPGLWQRIERAVAPGTGPKGAPRSAWSSLALWRGLAGAGLAAALALALVFALVPREAALGLRYVAVLEDEQAKPVFLVSVDPAAARLTARPIAAAPPDQADYELWLIAGDAAPRSLGLLDAAADTERALPAGLGQAIAEPALLAVSLEPQGGSPTGQPTGPVIWKGALLRTGT